MIDIELTKIIVKDLRTADNLEMKSAQEYAEAIGDETKSSFERIGLAVSFLNTLHNDLVERDIHMVELQCALGADPDEDGDS